MQETRYQGELVQKVYTADAADYLGLTPQALKHWRQRGGGPRFLVWGRRTVRYRLVDLDNWLEDQPTAGNQAEAVRILHDAS